MEKSKPAESFKFDFFGLKCEFINPGVKTIILLLILLCFLTGCFVILREFALPAISMGLKKKMLNLF